MKSNIHEQVRKNQIYLFKVRLFYFEFNLKNFDFLFNDRLVLRTSS